ncbi:anaphase-promoting complex subunit Apc2 [Schizosaccharomyces japonicus yFS275]|uniref:Anaphase-promoting complex subunit 2 n=1 Tax=Schizosaccharomyces japonicus (strain yFS275 / FY16936) TaxID=402676 RepID=B6K4L3_SCHJY|nr:anaphase-promoting complex subunit Apc2 [Schizosaccharomyces japonicus yFS275]EEB08420.1 anaphase-promoting complex subunit Apc2 [Schizosaccharomyces japonicus yFS275]
MASPSTHKPSRESLRSSLHLVPATPVDYFFLQIRRHFNDSVCVSLASLSLKSDDQLHKFVDELFVVWNAYVERIDILAKDPVSSSTHSSPFIRKPLTTEEVALIHARMPVYFQSMCKQYLKFEQFEKLLRSYLQRTITIWARNSTDDATRISLFFDLCKKLRSIGLEGPLREAFSSVLKRHIKEIVFTKFGVAWTESIVHTVTQWVRSEIGSLVEHIFGSTNSKVLQQLDQLTLDILANIRSEDMLAIVLKYPRSHGAVEDLRMTLRLTEQRSFLVDTFIKDCNRHVLLPSTSTKSLISLYILTIRCFTHLEPSGVLLNRVSKSIRAYLKERDDTIKCLMTSMFVDQDSELAAELARTDSTTLEFDGDRYDDLNWTPDPIDAAPDYKKNGDNDIVSRLLSIFNSKEVFVQELQLLLADRLLRITNYAPKKEAVNLELLRQRLGDASLQMCTVMIKDIQQSHEIDALIHRRAHVSSNFHATILSRLFWPKLSVHPLRLPRPIQHQLDMFAEEFALVKNKRELVFLPNLGVVDIDVELEDRTISMTVTPEQAAVLCLFQDSQTLDVESAAQVIEQNEDRVRKHMAFWVHHRVIAQVDANHFRVREKDTEETVTEDNYEAEQVSAVQSSTETAADEMRIYWSFVVGMLTNLGALELERIHNMLTMFVPPPNGYTRSQAELREFLALMIKEEKLEFTGGAYKLKQ